MLTVIKEFFMLGLLTFGGGMAMIPLFLDIAIRNSWLTEAQFSNFVAISQSTPGPIAINMATFIGFIEKGWLGSVAASAIIVVPGFLLSVGLSKFLIRNKDSVRIARTIATMKAAVLALLIYAIYVLARGSVLSGGTWEYIMFAAALLMTFRLKMPIVLYLFIFAVLGMVLL
ncbi:MAG: chromate transporter [Bacillota bacterium]|nr:chromate transporter [Bacillota bacterium]